MRSLNSNAIAKIATKKGTEPLIVLAVNWGGVLAEKLYADKAYPALGIEGRILEVSGLDESIVVSGGGNSQEISVTLDDTDGALKAIFDSTDVHKKAVRVYQWFDGLDYADKFLIFKGQINSTVAWNEGERKLSFTIINRIEDVEVGFSAEEGQFISLPEDLIGKPWPLCFGTCINVPALKAIPATSGTLAKGVGIKDFTLKRRQGLAEKITCPQTPKGFKCSGTAGSVGGVVCNIAYETDGSCVQARCTEIEKLKLMAKEQGSYEYGSFTVFGGEKFQQDRVITLNINGGKFTGKMHGNVFSVTNRRHPKDDGTGHVIIEAGANTLKTKCEGNTTTDPTNYQDSVFGPLYTGIKASQDSWKKYRDEPSADFFWAQGGSAVTLDNAEILYIANILPSTILRVAAYRTINGNRFLLTVPSTYYAIRQTDYTGYQVMELAFSKPLSQQNQADGGGWEDDIYITLTSSVGPNTVDIIQWFISTYTAFTVDATSFAAVRTKVDKYSQHFPLLSRKNLITTLQEIATQARCALWQKDDVFFIKYLAETPTTVDTITENDILPGTLEISLTRTEDLVTKYVAKWTKDHAITKPNTLILRHNVILYGTQDQTYDYYTFNILDNVRKTATYWLIRKSITWKLLKFSTPLTKLNLEAFDAVLVTLPDLGDGDIICIVNKAVYDSKDNQINFELWTPVPSGTRKPYNFAFPADVDEQALFPSIEERNAGQAGSGKEPNFSVISPPSHALSLDIGPVITGFGLTCNGDAQPVGFGVASSSGQCRQDHGDKKPSDTGDVKKTPDTTADDTGGTSTGTSPVSNGQGSGDWSIRQFQADQAKQANTNANNAQAQAQRAQDAASGKGHPGSDDKPKPPAPGDLKDHLDRLPKPEDVDPEENPCQVIVTTSYFNRVQAGSHCIPVGGMDNVVEHYVFNDCAAAKAMAESVRSMGDCGNTPPCMAPCTAATVDENCVCSNESPGIIGYDRSDPDADPILSM